MKTVIRGLISVAFALLTSIVYAGHPAPGVQITVKNKGGATVFQAITDNTGQFSTGDLEPGEYQFDVRGAKVVPPVRYFLVLSGARPVGQTMTNAAGDLAMQAQVRRQTSIRGQVSASRIIVLPGVAPSASAPPSPITTSSSSNQRPAGLTTVAGQRPSATPAGVSSATTVLAAPGKLGVPSSAASTPSRSNYFPVTTPPRASTGVATSSPSPARTASPAPAAVAATSPRLTKMIGGKRYIWVPTAPGSNLGRWQPEALQSPQGNVAPAAGARTSSSPQGGR